MRTWQVLRSRAIGWKELGRIAAESLPGFTVVMGALVWFGAARLLQASQHGLGLNGDSFYYLTGAETLAAGVGFGRISGGGDFVPTAHYPPFYSTAMAGLQVLGAEKLESARLISVLSLVGWLLIAGIWLRREAGSNVPAFIAGAILVTSPVILNLHVWAMSEPLYLALSFAGLALLAVYSRQQQLLILIGAGVAIAAALLTRYVGIALVATGLTVIASLAIGRRRKLTAAVILLGISSLPMVLWIARNARLTGNLANRNLLWHPVTVDHLTALVTNVVDWFVPVQIIARRFELPLLVPVAGAAVGGTVFYLWRAGRLNSLFQRWSLPGLLAVHSALYLAALLVSLTLFDPATQIDDRILVPIYVSVMLVVGLSWHRLWSMRGRGFRLGLLAGLASVLIVNGAIQARRVSSYGSYGLGNAAPSISLSETLAAAKALPPDAPIASNGMARLYFWADRNAYAIPWRLDVETGAARPEYQHELEGLRTRLCSQGGALVLFEPESLLDEQASIADLTAGMSLLGRYSDGEIHQCIQPGY